MDASPCSSVNVAKPFLVTDWVPLHSIDQCMKFSGSTDLSSYIVGNSNIPLIERLPSLPRFGSESLSEIMDSFVLPRSTQMASSLYLQDLPSTIGHGAERNIMGTERKRVPECGIQFNSPIVSHHLEGGQQKDVPTENDDKKQKSDPTPSAKDDSEANKENYVHFRAKRGLSTNSHSLAERVRRERISERMKLLQALVPGCNKITGKAVMLDEIINYVQSLQRQVEFLSMKVASVNPELNLDMEQSLHSRSGSSPTLGCCPQMHARMALPSITNSRDMLRTMINNQITPMVQMSNPWDSEFQNAIQMGLTPNISHNAWT